MTARPQLPTGTVTMLFTDIEGSTRLLQELGRDEYVRALTVHRRLLREAFTRHSGVEVEMQGDSFFFAFAHAGGAVAAAEDAQRALLEHAWEHEAIRVRVGVHTGEPIVSEGLYAGLDVHRAARVMSAGHGGQVLVSQTTRDLLDDEFVLRDLGVHRLKDLSEPVRVYQLGDDDFPPLKTIDASNLPIVLSPLVGRDRDLDEVLAHFRNGTRLLTITGAGGIGKTRLAIHAAAELVGTFADGVFWVPLSAVSDPDLVVPAIAQSMGIRGDVAQELRPKRLLLVLDNVEHLLSAAPAIADLISSAGEVRVLATSRAPLRIRGEREYRVAPLAANDAVMLFVDRARGVGSTIEPDATVAAICRRLDDLPLAIELAAPRTRLLTPAALHDRLERALPLLRGGARDAPERQQTLEATIAWSCDLLDEEARRLFFRLSVFAGSFSLEAAELVCDATLSELEALVELALLKAGADGRFSMLQTVREYAAERLVGEGGELVRRRHAAHFLELVEEAEPQLTRPNASRWLDRLETERDNLRVALNWAAAAGESEVELRIATALRDFWASRGPAAEALQRLENAVVHARDRLPERRLAALRAAALSALRIGDHAVAERIARRFLELARQLADRESEVSAYIKLAFAVGDAGRSDEATEAMKQAVATARDFGDRCTIGHALLNFGALALDRGDAEQAAVLSEQSLAEAGEEFDVRGRATALVNLATASVQLGDVARAAATARQALELAAAHGDLGIASEALTAIADVAADPDHAARLRGAADALSEQLGVVTQSPPERAESYSEGRALSLNEALELALAQSEQPALANLD